MSDAPTLAMFDAQAGLGPEKIVRGRAKGLDGHLSDWVSVAVHA